MNNIGTIKLETDRLILRRLELNDAEKMFNNWCNDEDVTRYLPWEPHGKIEVTKELLDMWVNDYNNEHTYRWIVILKDNNEPIGTIDVVKKDISNKVFELGHCYSKVSWGKGYATEAFKKVISFLFDEVGVEVIMAKHYENNLASGKVMLKSGMIYEATLRSRIIDKVTKERVGEVYYSITKDEYLRTM
ncbi:MAG: GNAT family N-acetyltransferase [Bacilli bacterium]|nr:GNAT family N-acetyltransferase [Bacilli bacterium]